MKLTLLGTGCPKVDTLRYGPANIVYDSKTKLLIDCGSGVTQRLEKINISSKDIDALFLTHLHSDHVMDFYQLILSSWHSYRLKPWKIYGPKGTKKFINLIMQAWKNERKNRIDYENRSSTKAFEIKVYEFDKYGKIKVGDFLIEYFEVDHKPVKYSFGFNFFFKDKKITISGDTKPCNNLMKYAQKTDLLLHEVFVEGELKPLKKMRSKKTLHNIKKYHTSSDDVGKIAKISKCKKLVLTHFVPPIFNEKKLISAVKKDFGKKPIIGRDLLTFKI